jgi:putative thioredoxin
MDATTATFPTAVIERSKEVPVVVDFWAEWCGPCKQLGPVLERAVAARDGKVELVKVDTDANPDLARAFNIQGIPAVKAFKNGAVASEFVGVQPPQAVDKFLDGLIPSEAESLAAKGDEASLQRAVELEPTRADAAVPLAKLLLSRGDVDEARQILSRVPGSFAADGLLARITLEQNGSPNLSEAFSALDSGETEQALNLLIEAVAKADGDKDEIRKVVVGVLDELGADTDLARSARRQLATALY